VSEKEKEKARDLFRTYRIGFEVGLDRIQKSLKAGDCRAAVEIYEDVLQNFASLSTLADVLGDKPLIGASMDKHRDYWYKVRKPFFEKCVRRGSRGSKKTSAR
jgi:hypothetical protein